MNAAPGVGGGRGDRGGRGRRRARDHLINLSISKKYVFSKHLKWH